MDTVQEIKITNTRGKPQIAAIQFTKEAKSLSGGHDWEDVQDLCVITGRNGVGKTQLLKYIDKTLEKYQPHASKFKHTFISARPSKMNSSSKDKPINLNQDGINLLVSQIGKAYDDGKIFAFYRKKTGLSILADLWVKDPRSQISKQNAEKIIYRLIELKFQSIPPEERIKEVIKETLDNTVISNNSIQVFQQHLNEYPQGKTTEIDKINDLFKANNVDMKLFVDDSSTVYCEKSVKKNFYISIGELSTGERVILETFLWLYILKHPNYPENVKPTIMLLDEPDSHLDPSLVEVFFNIIYKELVLENKIQIIFVTHRPDTVALAPPKKIFYLEREKNDYKAKIVPTHRLRAMFRLTPNLRTITNVYFEVYAESHTDAYFYEGVYHSLLIHTNKKRTQQRWNFLSASIAPSEEKYNLLSRRYQLNFVPVNPTISANSKVKHQGGCSEIKKCLGRDRNSVRSNSIPVIYQELQNLIHIDPEFYVSFGIVDNDNEKEKRVKDLKQDGYDEYVAIPDGRHSLENFTLDPFIFCLVLTEEEIQDFMNNSSLSDESTRTKFISLCREIKQSKLISNDTSIQTALDDYFRIMFETILEKGSKSQPENDPFKDIRNRLKNGDFCNTTIEIIVSVDEELKFQYPQEFLKMKGHDLADGFIGKKYREVDENGKPCRTNVAKLRDVITEKIKKYGIPYIPKDLASVFFDLNKKVRDHVKNIIKKEMQAINNPS